MLIRKNLCSGLISEEISYEKELFAEIKSPIFRSIFCYNKEIIKFLVDKTSQADMQAKNYANVP